jgi:hypothetical protein
MYSFAARCLPLVIANQAGWWILNNVAFEAIWDGTPELDCVKFSRVGSGELLAESHFGHGILTFRLPYLFRTPPSWQLLAKGPSNMFKDGIQALEGIVETSWAPQTFTMNWKFTRPMRPVRFEVGEPLCQIMPVQVGTLGTFEPVIRGEVEPELFAAYGRWRDSREAFLDSLPTRGAVPPNETYQLDYLRGSSPGGVKAPVDEHYTNLKLQPFESEPQPQARERVERVGGVPWSQGLLVDSSGELRLVESVNHPPIAG